TRPDLGITEAVSKDLDWRSGIARGRNHVRRMHLEAWMKIRIIFMVIATLLFGSTVYSQLAEDFTPPRSNCCLANTAKTLAEQLQDWNQLGRYYQANEQLKKQPPEPKRVVFMGDSITDLWRLEEYFQGKRYVNRGIGGQTT